jgi:hypothetical protein
VRRRLIRTVLPLIFCALPPLAAVLIAVSMPKPAREFYLSHYTPFDAFIIGLGIALFIVQTILAWRALRWRGRGFDERPDRWLTNLMQAAEWFPLLGLIGTVAGIMQTFAGFDNGGDVVSQQTVIARYASAITATCSGLFMALVNLLPGWVVTLGRDLIRTLAGGPSPPADGTGESPGQRSAIRQPTDGARV